MPLDDSTVPIPGPNEVFVDRNRYITSKWYPWVKRLFQSLRETMNELGVVKETVDQVAGTWTLSINDNDRVTGYVKLDGSDVSTVFAVMADKFVIVHPTANNTTIQAFIAGLVNGVSTIGINGNLLVDGSILARSLDVDALSAITADLGTVTAGVLQSPDGKATIDMNNRRILFLGT